MKKQYNSPEMSVELCSVSDIITASPITLYGSGSGYDDSLSWNLEV